MAKSGGKIISTKPTPKKPQPKPKATLEKEVVKVRTNGNNTTTQYPQRKTSSSDGKKVAVSELTKVTTRVPGKTKK